MPSPENRAKAGRKPGTFAPGQSGNPSGRPKTDIHIRDLARKHTEAAIATLLQIAQHGENESARVSAATALLDRAWGRPTQAVEVDGQVALRIVVDDGGGE